VLSGGAGSATAAYQAAQALSMKKTTYTKAVRTIVQLSQVPQGATMFDCSGSVSEVLALAGFSLPGGATFGSWAPVSGAFIPGAAGLVSGPGKQMTIWANSDHIFLEFNISGVGHYQGNTDIIGNNQGFRLGPWGPMGSTDAASGSFQAVHYPGT
jgi:hypothetical protein